MAASAAYAARVLAPVWALKTFRNFDVEFGDRYDLRVDGADHPALTVFTLRAIEPDRARVVYHQGVSWHCGRPWLDKLEAGEEASSVRHDVLDWYARICKGGLRDCVVLDNS